MDSEAFANMKVVELRQELKRRGLSTAGVKSNLIARLTKALEEEAQAAAASAPSLGVLASSPTRAAGVTTPHPQIESDTDEEFEHERRESISTEPAGTSSAPASEQKPEGEFSDSEAELTSTPAAATLAPAAPPAAPAAEKPAVQSPPSTAQSHPRSPAQWVSKLVGLVAATIGVGLFVLGYYSGQHASQMSSTPDTASLVALFVVLFAGWMGLAYALISMGTGEKTLASSSRQRALAELYETREHVKARIAKDIAILKKLQNKYGRELPTQSAKLWNRIKKRLEERHILLWNMDILIIELEYTTLVKPAIAEGKRLVKSLPR